MTDVTISLNGKDRTLSPTLRAAKIVNSSSDGFVGIFRRIQSYDLAAFVTVIAAGLGSKPEAVEDVEQEVYETGLEKLQEPVSRFVGILMNGGRDPKAAPDKAGKPSKN